MSTQDRTTIALTREQKRVFDGVRDAISEVNGDLTHGETVEELARAYPVFQVLSGGSKTNGTPDPDDLPIMCGLIEETAADVGDPTFTREQMESLDPNILRNMAKEASSDAITGRSTRLEIIAYFTCPCVKTLDPETPL